MAGLADVTSGSSQPQLTRENLVRVLVPLPPLSEQRHVAAILDSADSLRTKRRQVLDHLDALIQSTFRDMFGAMTQGVRWPLQTLGAIAETRLGKMLDAKDNQDNVSSWPYLRNANVQWFQLQLDDLLAMNFSEQDRATFALETGDVLVCEGGRPGRAAIWRSEVRNCYYQKALHRVRLGPNLRPDYFVRAMKAIVDEGGLKDYVTSSTIAHLTGEKLRTLLIPVPPLALQVKFEDMVASTQFRRLSLSASTVLADSLFAELQNRGFRGEL